MFMKTIGRQNEVASTHKRASEHAELAGLEI